MKTLLLSFLLFFNCRNIDREVSINLNEDKKIFETVLKYLETNELIEESVFYVESQLVKFDSTSKFTSDNNLVENRKKIIDSLSFKVGRKEIYIDCSFSNHMVPTPKQKTETETSKECQKYKSKALIQVSIPKVLDSKKRSVKVFYYINQGYKVFTFELERTSNAWIIDTYKISGWVYS